MRVLPSRPVLIAMAVNNLDIYAQDYEMAFNIREDIKTWAKIVEIQKASDVLTKAHLAILRIYLGTEHVDRDEDSLRDVTDAAIDLPSIWAKLVNVLYVSKLPHHRISALLLKVYSIIGASHPSARGIIGQLRGILQRKKSDLDNHITWNKLALPLPYPKPPVHGRIEGGVPARPICIESIELKDIGGIHHLHLPFSPPRGQKGQWVVILGPNGIGKTTILRSLALALRNVNNPAIWPKGAFANAWRRLCNQSEPQVRDASIVVQLPDGSDHKTLVRPDDTERFVQLPAQIQSQLFPLFAYGCRRGSALGGAAREVNLNEDDGPEIATLFDEGANLIHAETWLLQLEAAATKNKRSKTVFDSVTKAVRKLLDLEQIEIVDRKVLVTERTHLRLPFSSLSDGYLTNVGWFLDLIARWIAFADRHGISIGDDVLNQMRGLVLIDEIDLHLHPKWQIEIINRTRKLLPQMSFIVTTHNPLTLVGAKAEEIWVLTRESGSIKAARGVEAPMLLTGGQIYRRYFGIDDIYPNSLGRALQRYSFLTSYERRNKAENAELEKLKSELQRAGINPDWDIIPGRTDVEAKKPGTKIRSVKRR